MSTNDQWGNIELPGLSDEELFKTNWNKVAHAQTKIDNPEFSQRMSQAAHLRNTNLEYVERQRTGVKHNRDNNYQAITNARPEVRAKISKSLKGKEKTPEHLAKVAEQNRLRSKTIQIPNGIFDSRKQAVEYMTSIGIVNAGKKLDKWLKTKPTEYYYLDK